MDCFYINLDAQPGRRAAIEKNFGDNRIAGWSLARFEAVNVRDVEALAVPGVLRPEAKGCFLSHRELIRQNLSSDAPMMILEDDALFGSLSCKAIDISLAAAQADWDIIFTDVSVGDVGAWPDFVRLRRDFEHSRDLKLLDLAQLQFSGSTSYILNARSKRLLLDLLDAADPIDLPYDIYLRALIRLQRLKAYVIVPFATSISDLAEQSSVHPLDEASSERIWNLFRRMIWIERDLTALGGDIDAVRSACSDDETRMFAVLFEALMSGKVRT